MKYKVRKLRLVGYDLYNRSAYRMWHEEQRRLCIRRDVKFVENTFNITESKKQMETVEVSDLSCQKEYTSHDVSQHDGNEELVPSGENEVFPVESEQTVEIDEMLTSTENEELTQR